MNEIRHIMKFNTSMTDLDLISYMVQTARDAERVIEGVIDKSSIKYYIDVTVEGFDEDDRELNQIPEAIRLFKRIVRGGIYGLLMHPAQWGCKIRADYMEDADCMLHWLMPIIGGFGEELTAEDIKRIMERSCDAFNRLMMANPAV